MTNESLIFSLLETPELQRLAATPDTSSVLDLLQDLIDERAFTRIIAYFLESNESHGLGDYFLKSILRVVGTTLKPYERLHSTAISEWKTFDNNFLDTLVVVHESALGQPGDIKFVVGLENKIFASEREEQLSDYQKALTRSYPQAKRLLLFLTPDGRAGATADSGSRRSCPVRQLSYHNLVQIAESAVARAATPDIKLLLRSIPRFVKKYIISEYKVEGSMQELLKKINRSPKKKKALAVIAKNIFLPNIRNLIYEYIIRMLQEKHPGAYVEWHYPRRTPSPNEFNIAFADLYRAGLGVYYQLWRRDSSSPFGIRIMAWCEKPRHRRYVEKMRERLKLPRPEGETKEWGQWCCLWAGPEYRIKDQEIERMQSEPLLKLLSGTIKRTHSIIEKYLRIHKL